jgi:predicted nuclease with TOPRIM domain
MAKQDLVVKLLLDSGAFGNDLREAERRAQQFSNNMKNAGNTAGSFTKEIGLSTGAIGKLGKALTGAGAVVAAVGAFKSIMETTSGTADAFQSTIAGFQGVLSEFQESIARFDFSNFNNGLIAVFKNAREAKKAMQEMSYGSIGYDYLVSGYKEQLKGYKVSFGNAKSSGERDAITNLVNATLEEWDTYTKSHSAQIISSFKAKMKNENDLLDLSKIDDETAEALMREAAGVLSTEGGRKSAMSDWKTTKRDMQGKYWSGTWKDWRAEFNRKFQNWDRAADLQQEADAVLQEYKDDVKTNQKDMFLNEIYHMNEQDLRAAISELDRINNIKRELSDAREEARSWTSGGGDTEPDPAKGSIKYLQNEISELEKERSLLAVGSNAWKEKTDKIYENMESLEELIKKQELYEMKFSDMDVQNMESIGYIQEMISFYENLRDTLNVGSAEWIDATDTIDYYNEELKRLIALQDSLLGVEIPPKPIKNVESISYIKEMISFYEELRDTMTVGSAEWIDATDAIDSFKVELAELLEIQAAYDGQYDPVEKQNDWNDALESGVFLFNSLSSAMAQAKDESLRDAAPIMSMFGAIAEGALNVIPALQALTAAEGAASAAATPWPANIAAIMSIIATVTSVFASIKQLSNAGKFAEGGIVGGTSYSGDKLFAMVNSGEMILNKRQQGNLANMIGGGGQVEFHISGDSLVGVLNNKRNKTNLTR